MNKLKLKLLEFWESFFANPRTTLNRFLTSVAISAWGFGIVALVHFETGVYVSSITIITTIIMTLYSGLYLGLMLTFTISLLADYFYIPPIGSVLDNRESMEHLLMLVTLGIGMNLFIYSLRYAYTRTILAKQEAEKVARAMEQVLALVSHDIRNPLAASKISAELITRYPDKHEKHMQLATRVVENLNRVDSMITTLLDVSRIRAGNAMILEFEYADLASLVAGVVEDLTTVYGNRFRFEKPQPLFGKWSSEGVRRSLENLATNALKYGASDAMIDIKLSSDHGVVTLSVHNEGKEIRVEDQVGLFDFFHRTSVAERGNEKGWGLGLALVKGIAESHGGQVSVDSGNGKGTTFLLRLPLQQTMGEKI